MKALRLAALTGLLLALVGAAAYTLPRWLDWERHRVALAAIASERLGRFVALRGPVTLVLLPEPRIEASDLLIGESADDIGIAARGLRMRLDLWALLTGRIEVREIALLGAEIRLPWPPGALPGLVPPPWLTALDARIEDSRIAIGGAVVEGVTARLTAGGATEALLAEGQLTWRGRPMRFQAALGRAADDGVGALDFLGEAEGAVVRARGALLPQGGFDGRLEAAGPSLAALLPAPPEPFRATAELRAGAESLVARNLALELGPPGAAAQSVRGSATLALLPEPEFRLALAAPRMDVEPWLAALRGAGAPAIPLRIEFAAEQSRLGAVALRRLRGTTRLAGPRLALNDVAAELPGGTEVQINGGGEGGRLELSLRVRSAEPARLAEVVGWPAALHPGVGPAEAQARLAVEGAQFSVSGLEARWGEAQAQGGFVWRAGARPSLALGLEFDRLAAADPRAAFEALRAAGEGMDLQLRLGVGRLVAGGAVLERLTLDGAAEGGRLVVRRAAARGFGLDLALTGTLAAGRVQGLSLEGAGPAGPLLAALGAARPDLAERPLRATLSGAGPLEALALRLEADLADARLEAQGSLDLPQARGQGSLTLRHPGAPRLLGLVTGGPPPDWIGQGSLSLVAGITHRPGHWAAESAEFVAGALRGRGQLSLALGGPRPSLSGRLAFENLPLPPGAPAAPRLPLELDLALAADRVERPGWPVLEAAEGRLAGGPAELRLADGRARLGGGRVSLAARLAASSGFAAEGSFDGVALPGPVLERPMDVTGGRLAGRFALHGPAADRATLCGEAEVTLRDGVLQGLDAPRAAAALGWADAAAAEAALAAALAGGSTTLSRARLRLALEAGTARIAEGALTAEGGLALDLTGRIALGAERLDLRLAWPVPPGAPPVALEITGPLRAPERRPEVAAFLDWRRVTPP
ncbi:MAG: AsmA family protein [Rubritepida sp.]|nr:AsmA family protein [Rubritepida sp.]